MKTALPESPLFIATIQLGLLLFLIYYILIGGQTALGIYDPTWRLITLGLTSSIIGGWLGWRLFSAHKIPRTPLDFPLLFLLGSWLLSTFFSVNPVYSRETLVFLGAYLLFFYLAADGGRWSWGMELTFNALLGVAGLVWMLALLQLAWWYQDYIPAPALFQSQVALPRLSVLGNPNTMASFLALVIPIALYKLGAATSKVARLLLALWIVMLVGALILTQSRGGWLAFFVSLGFLLLVSWRRWSKMETVALPLKRTIASLGFKWRPGAWWGKIGVALVLVGLGGSLVWLTLSMRSFSEGVDIRRQVMAGAVKTLWKHPLSGSGLGTLGEELLRNQQPLSRIWADAHNLYLTLAAETGLIGVIGLAWLAVAGVKVAWVSLQQPDSSPERRASLACLAALLGFAAHNLVDSLLKFPLIMLLAAILAGFWLRPHLAGEDAEAKWSRPWVVLALLLLIGITSLGLQDVRTLTLYNQAVKAAGQADWPTAVTALQAVNQRAPAMPFYERQLGFAAGHLARQEPTFLPEAISQYQAALSRLDQLSIDHANLSCLLAEAGRQEEALQAMQLALALEPDQPLYHLNLGRYLEAMGDQEAAQREYAQLLRRQPHLIQSGYWSQTETRTRMLAVIIQEIIQDQATGLPALIQLSLKSQGAEAAQTIYDNYLATKPVEPALAHLEQGKILLAQDRLEPAQAEFEAAIRLNPYLAEAYLRLSQVAGLAQQWEEAASYVEAAVFLEPAPAVWYQQALVAEARGEIEVAIERYETAFDELTISQEIELSRYATETARRRPFPVSHYLPCLARIYPTELLVEITRREGSLLEQQGDYQSAGQVYRRLLGYEPGVEPVVARLRNLCQGQAEACGE